MVKQDMERDSFDLRTPYPLEDMYSYCVKIVYNNNKVFLYTVDTILCSEAKHAALQMFLEERGTRNLIKSIEAMKVYWLSNEIFPEIYWEDNKDKEEIE